MGFEHPNIEVEELDRPISISEIFEAIRTLKRGRVLVSMAYLATFSLMQRTLSHHFCLKSITKFLQVLFIQNPGLRVLLSQSIKRVIKGIRITIVG